ncbi:MAG: hypothetical protein WCL32_25635 [Planctomycetota bacterium]|jgi:hypothetical protein
MALRLLTATLPRQEIGREEVIAIVEYHLHRNRVALASHIKAWKERHKKVRYKVLL